MVEQVTFQTIFQFLQTVGILTAVYYYIMTLRNTNKARQRELIIQRTNSLEHTGACADLFTQVWEDAEEWQKKYGLRENPEAWSKYAYVINTYNLAGMLLKTKEADPELIFQLYHPNGIIHLWDKLRLVIEDIRERHGYPSYAEPFEFLYNEAVTRYPTIRREGFMNYHLELKT